MKSVLDKNIWFYPMEHDMFRKYEIVKFMSELRKVWEYMDSLRWLNIVD